MYAIYQVNYVVLGTGETREAALEDARQWMDDEPEIVELHNAADGDIVSVLCTDELHTEVQANGGDVRCEIVEGTLRLK